MHRRRSIRIAGALLLGLAAPSAAQQAKGAFPPVPGGGDLLSWLGLEPGDTRLYERESGDRFCVEVGRPRELGGRRWVALRGLPWPGLATDSQILVPLDGALELGVIRTPGPRPRASRLLEPSGAIRPYDLPPDADPLRALTDGWYAIGDPADPGALLYVWCAACMDAGLRIRFEQGRGIVSVHSVTIAGAERLTLLDEPCACPDRGVELRLEIDPAPPRRP